MARTKTIAVTETVWEKLKEIMRKEHAGSMSEVIARLVERGTRVPSTKFGVHRNLKIRLTQEEHEEITSNLH